MDNDTIEELQPCGTITDEQYQAARKWAVEYGIERKRTSKQEGSRFSEADFFAGAMSVLCALGRPVVPDWYFTLLRGNSVIGEATKARKVKP